MKSYDPSVLENRPRFDEERTGTAYTVASLMKAMGGDGLFCALPPDQITTFLSNGYSTNDRVLAWSRKYTSGFMYRSAYCTAVPYDDNKSPDLNATSRPPLRAADCARKLGLSQATVSRSLRHWSERGLLQIDDRGAIRLNGAVPPNLDQPVARSNAHGPCAGVQALLSPQELLDFDKLSAEMRSREHTEIAKATTQIRQDYRKQLEIQVAERWGIRRIGRQQWARVNGKQTLGSGEEHLDPDRLEGSHLTETRVHETGEPEEQDAPQTAETEVQDEDETCTPLDSLCTSKPIFINRDLEKEERKQLLQPIDSPSPTAEEVTREPNCTAVRDIELRAVLERHGFAAIGEAHLVRIGQKLGEAPLPFFERWLKDRLKHGELRSGGLPLVADDARRRWASECASFKTAGENGLRQTAGREVVCDQCYGRGYTGDPPGSNSIIEIRAAIHAKSIQTCTCESARTLAGLLQDD